MSQIRRVLLALALLGTLGACGEGSGKGDGGTDGGQVIIEATWTSIEENVVRGCTGSTACHAVGNTNEYVGGSRAAWIDVPSKDILSLNLVTPGDAANSYVVIKISDNQGAACVDNGQAAGLCGARMPKNVPALSAQKIEAITQWINDGALDN